MDEFIKTFKDLIDRVAELSEDKDTAFLLEAGGETIIPPHLLHEACKEACAEYGLPDLETPLYLLLKYTWNDIIDWTEEGQ